ncbi:scavenger receptor class B member 1 [Aedes albopictus]|uniref:Plasma membrane glycoprotein cd36 n=1 Tax=Aedes albopictus TaxID=7160 RepID=A0ABM1YJY6_AEDAL|nr:scavenger receptor class B member 1 [Aedes albopictus]XP_029726150.1 scavenger receptor class B member 1 [Aedes albopictus]
MGLHKNYFKVGQNASNQLFGLPPRGPSGATPLSMLISQGAKFNNNRIAVIIFGIATLIAGVILSSVPWLNIFIMKNLRLWNGTISFHYWQRPGVTRLTKVYIFNVTNPEGFLAGEKPKLVEVGPFVYREDMEKVNIKFHDNYTVTYQHKKILQFVPELSVDKNQRITTPNIPLLTISTQSKHLGYFLAKTISLVLTATKYKPFISLTADELVFGYDDTLVSLAHRFYPRNRRPMSKMGLLNGRNGTLTEYATMYTGHTGMEKFGYFDKLNGLDHLPHWDKEPCSSIEASEGSFFPPREVTNSDVVYIYDKDLCRSLPLVYRHPVEKDGIPADLYTLAEDSYGPPNGNNSCFDHTDYKPYRGLQNISPCQYGAPVYISNPHFYQSDPQLLEAVEGLNPQRDAHETFFKIQPKLGVPLEGQVRVQLNLLVEEAPNVMATKNFRDFVFPIMWLEEGVSELTPPIRRWIYLATVFAPMALPIVSYGMILTGTFALIYVFVRAYKNFVFTSDPTTEFLEMGRRSLRRGSSMIINGQHRILMQRDSYILLKASEDANLYHHTSNNNTVNTNNNSSHHNHNLFHLPHMPHMPHIPHHQPKDQSLLSDEDSPA